jgi:hypothetical protein
MSDFPQMPKRSVELPLGCKDLVDSDAIRNWKPAVEPPWQTTNDRLGYVEGQLSHLLQSAGKSKLVSVLTFQGHGHIMVIQDADLDASVVAAHWRTAPEQEALRNVFEEVGVPQRTEPVGRWKTKGALKYTLPADDSQAARLISEVFRAGYGLGILATIRLSYHESKRA